MYCCRPSAGRASPADWSIVRSPLRWYTRFLDGSVEYASGGTRRLLLFPLCAVIAAPLPAGGKLEETDNTWIEIGGTVYGCIPDSTGPVEAGMGTPGAVVSGEHEATSVEQLIAGLHDARPGETVYIPGEAVLDFTSLVLAGDFALQLPAGVTLAGYWGTRGSAGALPES